MAINHQSEVDIYKMVFARLPFLADTPGNQELISLFALEIMNELEPCFRVDKDSPDPTHVGDEQYYTIIQLSIVADVVSCYILMIFMAANVGGTDTMGGTTPVPATTTYLKRAKAGSVEVEYGSFDINKDAGMTTSGIKLLEMYKASAIRKGHNIGCLIDICADCTIAVEVMQSQKIPANFMVNRYGSDCGCN